MLITRNLIKLCRINCRSLTLSSNIDCKDSIKCAPILKSFYLFDEFINEDEECLLLRQVEKLLKRKRYEDSHFDYAIKQYKEIEFCDWNEANLKIINRIRELGFSNTPLDSIGQRSELNDQFTTLCPETSLSNKFSEQSSKQLPSDQIFQNQLGIQQLDSQLTEQETGVFRIIPEVHVLDLRKDGYIKPHVDAVRFCGSRIIGLSLCSDAVMRLANIDDKEMIVDVLLKRRSLYMMIDFSRYNCTHEIMGEEESFFRAQKVPRDRRVSIICRCLPDKNVEERIVS